MKKLHLFVIKSFFGPFLLTFFISNFLFLMIWLFKYIEDMVGQGLDISVILEVVAYASVNQIPMSLPLAVLLSSIMTLGNLGESNELVAAKSLGISLQKLIQPLIFFAFGLSIFAFFASNNIIPVTNLKVTALLSDIKQKNPELNIPEGVFYDGIPNYNIYVDKKDEDGTLNDLIIHDHSSPLKNNKFTVAKKGVIKTSSNKQRMFVTLFDGYTLNEEDYREGNKVKTYPLLQNKFEKQEFSIKLNNTELERSDGAIFKHHSKMMSLDQLVIEIDSVKIKKKERSKKSFTHLQNTYFFKFDSIIKPDSAKIIDVDYALIMDTVDAKTVKKVLTHATQLARGAKTYINSNLNSTKEKNSRIRKYVIETHKKFTLAVSCIVLFFIGAPFGAITRKGGLAWPVVYSISLFVIYWVITMVFEKLARNGGIPIYLGMWMSNIVLFPIGIYFTSRATKDLPMFGKIKRKKRKENASTSDM